MDGREQQAGGLAVLVALVQTIGTTVVAPAKPNILGYVLLTIGGLALTDRHRKPGTTVVITGATTLTYLLLHYPAGPTFIAPIFAVLAALAVNRHRLVAAAELVAYGVWVGLSGITLHGALVLAGLGFGAIVLAEVLAGIGKEARRAMTEQARADSERKRRQASDERLRIAQELHDVLGHHLSLINVRAGVGLHLMDREPEQARIALDTVKQASAEALREVRSVLDALAPDDAAAPRKPAPGLDQVDELLAAARASVTHTGEPRPLPAEIDRAAYRIVQESLTNVRRHAAPGAAVTVLIDHRPDELTITVDNDGDPVAGTEDGNGITGMRERCAAVGGSLVTQALPAGGWRVLARLPLPRDTP